MAHIQYRPIKAKRLFGPSTLYSEISWNDFPLVIRKFKEQLSVWHLAPVEQLLLTPDYSFSAMSLACNLVDTLGQYFYGIEEGGKTEFKNFLNQHFPDFANRLAVPILSSFKGKVTALATLSDVLYHGFRCGVVHEAHIKLYTGIVGQDALYEFHASGFTRYEDGTDCPTVIIDPVRFVEQLKIVFEQYFVALLDSNPANDFLRDNFKRKFKWSFGIDIGNEI